MTIETTSSTPTQLLRGCMVNLRKTRCNQDFFFTKSDRGRMGATAIAAGLAGLGGIAVGLGSMAMDTSEEADLLEFNLNGKPVKAWVWQSVFNEGDDVEVVAEQWEDHWQGYGIRRVSDKIVALHPHCSRGRYAHYRTSLKLWLKVCLP
ncbi:putative type VI secretion system effector, partial [Paraburkholderia sp. RL17-381-BIF-C]|uniref:putative type VI secretion system effector n=1 Tax=Paraburkholderia sp. RL17-381-BIF-C TaxID=3031635 RepID=UPI0038B81CC0